MNAATARVLKVAQGQIGTRENPPESNSVKYNKAYYKSDVRAPWCVVFQWWCFQKAGLSTAVFPKANNVFAVRDWYRARGRFNRTPKPGALVIYSFSHIGIVEKVLGDGRIQAIEGNTDARGSRTGGKVMRKVRSRNILGYCHPDYARAAEAPKHPNGHGDHGHSGGTHQHGRELEALYTSARARAVKLPAQTYKSVRFTDASANEGKFWTEPKDGKGGFAVACGPGLFVANITMEVTGLKPGTVIHYRLVETDPKKGYERVRVHAPNELRITGGGLQRGHATTTSRLAPGRHLWVQVSCKTPVEIALIRAEVIFMRRSS
jgi:hypothetical protein